MKRKAAALLGLAATAVATAIGERIPRTRERLAAVAPDLRGPALLWLPFNLRSRTVLRLLRLAPHPATPLVPGVTVRRRYASNGAEASGPAVGIHVYEPAARTRTSGALLWLHGGGYIMGSSASDNTLCSRIAAELGILVVSVDYRLAPEHPFPSGLDDAVTALRWLHGNAGELGIDPRRIAVGGESAGGGLAAALAQRAHDEGDLAPCFQLLVYPMLDDRTALDAAREPTFVWTPASNRFGWTCYLGHPLATGEMRPYAVPARRPDLGGLAPAWIGVGDLDLFHDEDVAYAGRLGEAGVPCVLEVVPGMYHGALSLVPAAPAVTAFRASAIRALGAAVNPGNDQPVTADHQL
ncbi:alpha/beta hydrolase [Saccharomonospora sp. NPDC006951]